MMICGIGLAIVLAGHATNADWVGFRGPGALGVSDVKGLVVNWSETENLAWKIPLPGPGSSSPIVLGDRVFVTCYSGYGLDRDNPGDQKNLKRHLLCINANDGKLIWNKTIDAVLPEDPYKGMFREHGYASQTPATDGQRIYVFFGKTGVLAFDLNGEQLWHSSVGTGSDKMLWGSASSPVLHKNMVFVNAWDESKMLYALDKKTGEQVWKRDLSETGLTFCTPVVADSADGKAELIISLSSELWGLNPDTGESLWSAYTDINDSMIPTPVVVDGVAYINGGGPRSSGSLAVRTGGKGDVTKTHVVWSSKEVYSPPSPVIVDGLMYWVDGSGKACCADAATGKLRYGEKLPASGRFAVYASVMAADGKIYAVTRKGGTFVLAAKPTFQILAHNKFASDDSDFNGSPAVSARRLFLRSNRFLYCLKEAP
jgi:outer membrane protein assembly factor BamB